MQEEKYLVEVVVPALDCAVDLRLPAGLTFGQAAELALALAAQAPGADVPLVPPGPLYFYRPDGEAYPAAAEIGRSDLRSGMRLVLM